MHTALSLCLDVCFARCKQAIYCPWGIAGAQLPIAMNDWIRVLYSSVPHTPGLAHARTSTDKGVPSSFCLLDKQELHPLTLLWHWLGSRLTYSL